MAPYRSASETRGAPDGPQPGLVADMVRQFADPYAFLRELVQNGIDAGARRIVVRAERLADAVCATSVTDDGCGMSRETIEGPLLTLFSSSKEGDTGKIGKYGVGFVSVFSIQPERVDVDTWRDGQAWVLRMAPDTSYELEDAGPRAGCGTRVTLIQRMDREAFAVHAGRAQAALRRWCRHASCALELVVVDPESAGGAGDAERIDTPLAVAAAITISVEEGGEAFVVGPSAGTQHLPTPEGGSFLERAASFAGFYNRGLTLFETSDEVFEGLSGVRFKAMSPRFQHTLSRDNVRRDDAFREALARVRALVKGPLRRELAARLGPAAAEAAAGRDVAAYVALVEAALSPPTALDPDEIPFPLTDPLDGARARADLPAMLARREPLLTALSASQLTAAVTAAGKPVVSCRHAAIPGLLERCFPGVALERVHDAYLLLHDVRGNGKGDDALRHALAEALSRARHEVGAVGFCKIQGAQVERAAFLLPEGDEAEAHPKGRLSAVLELERAAARWRPTHRLYLNVRCVTVALARRRAAADPVTAGSLLARAVIVEAKGEIGAKESDGLLELGFEPGFGAEGAVRRPGAPNVDPRVGRRR